MGRRNCSSPQTNQREMTEQAGSVELTVELFEQVEAARMHSLLEDGIPQSEVIPHTFEYFIEQMTKLRTGNPIQFLLIVEMAQQIRKERIDDFRDRVDDSIERIMNQFCPNDYSTWTPEDKDGEGWKNN